jgi:hypothetical protein
MTGFQFYISCFRLSIFSLFVLALAACGGGGDGGATASSDIGTLAYVVTECQDTGTLFSEHQALHILHGDQDVTVMETPGVGPFFPGVGGLCKSMTLTRFGQSSIAREAFQGVAVSPDGAAVVFEVSDDFSVFPALPLHLPSEQKGIFFVRADGSGLRWLGPPSRLPFFFLPTTGGIGTPSSFAFSPDGRTITFADTGPDAAGNQAGQVWTLDVGSGLRRQVTHLPRGVPPADLPSDFAGVINPSFIDNQTIGFLTDAYGLRQGHFLVPFTVRSDGSEEPKAASFPVTLPDSQIVPTFVITGDKPAAVSIRLPGQAQNADPLHTTITEVFVVDGSNLLQLTDFRRVDTSAGGGIGAIVDVDRQTVFFAASADPLGSNPSGICQIFAIDRLGGNSRQLTQFSAGQQTTNGCFFNRPPGCAVGFLRQDSGTRKLVFYSSCDPLGSSPLGSQVFAMRPDGSDLRQLTDARGLVQEPDGTFLGELPGPFAYGPYAP